MKTLQASELIVTHGSQGGTVVTGGDVAARCLPPSIDVVDAAGAGDALAGAYLAARLAGVEPDSALRRGVTAASLSCRSRGCAASYPAAAEIDAVLSAAPA